MDAYQYKYGDRPLEGYTIQRAAGRGGFGEVYYAVSDSGRQVALKVVQSHEQIELRGISQCMNLKSPHLVTVFDVKYNDQKRPFVVMEYVSGPSLSDLLKESPGGLGTQKAAFFLREIAKGLSYLHECGIVHRDLKPSNIFYENGYAKIGDYGLTKAISASRHVSHTITVGTVHYMAPEIGAGKYDRSVDIYALGVLLYEMLTGQVPFLGASPGEILMKHMTAHPDLSNVEEPFARVIRKALAKDPAERYQTVQELVEDVFGAEHVRNSVSQFAPEELSMVAEHVAQKIGRVQPKVGGQAGQPGQRQGEKDFSKEVGKKAELIAKKVETISGQVAEKLKTVKQKADQAGRTSSKIVDTIGPNQRKKLVLMTMAAVALGAGLLSGGGFFPAAIAVFVMVAVASKIIFRARWHWWPGLDEDSRWLGKAGTCLLASFLAVMLGTLAGQLLGLPFSGGWGRLPFRGFMIFPWMGGPAAQWGGSVLTLAVPMLLTDWWKLTDPKRDRRVTLGSAIGVGFLGFIAGSIFSFSPIIAACALGGIVLVVQTASPMGQAVANAAQAKKRKDKAARSSGGMQTLPSFVRPLWLVGFVITVNLGLILILLGAMEWRGDEAEMGVTFGVDFLIMSLFCVVMVCRSRFTTWWRYLIKPVILLLCVCCTVTASMFMGFESPRHEEFVITLLLIILPSLVFLILAFIPGRKPGQTASGSNAAPRRVAGVPAGTASPCKRLWALVLALVPFVPFLPLAGLHRFYVGKIGTGILWLFTGGLLGIGQFIDIIVIIVGRFRDKNDLPVLIWHNPVQTAGVAPQAPAPAVAAVAQQAAAPEAVEPAAQQADAAPAPEAAEQKPASWPSYPSTGTVIYEPWHPLSGLICAFGHILALAAILVGLAVALHLPAVVASGWPNPDLAQELEQLFGYAGWPALMERLGAILLVVLFFLAAVLVMIGRRKSGPMHLMRALLGLGGFLFAVYAVQGVISPIELENIVEAFQGSQVGLGIERLLSACSQDQTAIAAVTVLLSVLVLAWPPRRRTPVFAPMPNQGVS